MAIFDQNSKKQGNVFHGIEVVAPIFLACDYVVIAVLNYGRISKEIFNFLMELGYEKQQIIHIYDIENEEIFNGQKLVLMPAQVSALGEESLLRKQLCDEESRQVYDAAMLYLKGKRDVSFPAHAIEEQYLSHDVYLRNSQELFADCGGFKGEVMRFFLEKMGECLITTG